MRAQTMSTRWILATSLAGTLVAAALVTGCASSRSGAPRVNKPVTGSTDFNRGAAHEKLTSDQLEQLTNAFADRYRTLMEDAVREIVRGNKDARQRAVAQRMLVETTSSVYDIASNGDPFSQVLDLTIVVTLTSQVWIDGDRATREFGPEHAEPMITALRQARKEVWEIAGKVFLPDQLSALDFLIAGWRRDNPKVEDVAYVRFNDFAESRGEKIVEEAAGGGGLFEPLDKAVEQAKNYERLGERIFFLAKRLPTLASWQSEAVVDEIIAKEEVGRALGNLDSVSKSVESLSKTATQVATDVPVMIAKEREAIFTEIDKRQTAVDHTLGEVKVLVDATAPIVQGVNQLANTSERLMTKVIELKGPPTPVDPNAPPAKPFDVADYQRLLAQASLTLAEANKLAASGESLAGSPSLKGLIDKVTDATQERIDKLEETVQRLIWQLALALSAVAVLGFLLAVAYRETGRRKATAAVAAASAGNSGRKGA